MPGGLAHLVRYKVRNFVKSKIDMRANDMWKMAGSGVVFGGFALSSYYFSGAVISYLLEHVHLGLFLLHRFLSMMLFVLFLSINVGNIIVSYAALYRSKETAYLLTRPLSHTTVFLVKFFDNFFYSSTTLLLMASAILLGYTSYFHETWLFFFRALLLLCIPFMLMSAAVAVMILLGLVFLASKAGPRTVIGGGVVAYIASVWIYFRIVNPMHLVNTVLQRYPDVDQYFGGLEPAVSKFLPNTWVADALYWARRGDAGAEALYTGIVVAAALCAVAAMAVCGRLWYYKSWLRALDVEAARKEGGGADRLFGFARRPAGDPQAAVLLKKEFWQFCREPSQWIHLAIILILIMVFLTSISQVDFRGGVPFLQTVSYLVLFVFNAFLIAAIALRFVYPMIGAEGDSIWILRSAPISAAKLYWLKYLFAAVPILIVGEVLGVVSHFGASLHTPVEAVALGCLLFIVVAVVGMNLGAGSYFSNFRESNPIRAASSQGATLSFLLCIVYLVLLVSVLFFPLARYFDAVAHGRAFEMGGLLLALGLIAAASLTAMLISATAGIAALRRDL